MKYNIDESVENIVEDMRKLTILTGQLSSVHEETLYTWPLVLFDNIENIEIKYDLTKEYTQRAGEGYVVYRLEISPENVPKEEEFVKLCKILTSWVRDMLWDDIKVDISTSIRGYTDSSKDKKDGLKQD
jgi:hypothetical protein